jgi:hypothetical protein
MFSTLSDIIKYQDSKIHTDESYLKSIRKNLTELILSINPNAFIIINPETELSLPRITCAAIQNELGDIIVGARHYDVHMREQLNQIKRFHDLTKLFSHHVYTNYWDNHDSIKQGFVDQHGKFYDRKSAWVIAKDRDQIIRIIPGSEGRLYSENLY